MTKELRKELRDWDDQWTMKLCELWQSSDRETEDRIHDELDNLIKRRSEILDKIYRIEDED